MELILFQILKEVKNHNDNRLETCVPRLVNDKMGP